MTDLPVSLFPFWAQLLASTGSVLCLLLIVWRLPLAWLKQAQNQHLLLGATVAVLLIWAFRAGISPGLSIHFLGVTSLTLIFGWRLALLSLAVVCVGMVLAGKETWASLGIVYLVSAVAPVALNWGLCQWVKRRLPKHLFVYLFVTVFAAAALVSITVTVLMSLVMIGLGIYSFDQIAYEYLSFIPLIALPEAVLNGFVMTGLVILRPAWVTTYDEALYLGH